MPESVEETPGGGLSGFVDGKVLALSSEGFLIGRGMGPENGLFAAALVSAAGSVGWLAVEGRAAADVGIAMGAHGTAAAAEAGDVVLLADRLDRVPEAITIARRARRIALQAILLGVGLSLIAMVVAALGWLETLHEGPAQLA